MKHIWQAIVAVAALVASAFAAFFYRARGRTADAARVQADAVERVHAPVILEAEQRIGALKKEAVVNQVEVAKAEQDLAAKKESLRAKFESHGLSAEDIRERLSRIRL